MSHRRVTLRQFRYFIAVAESGMRIAHDVMASAHAGADAILVGSAVSAASDPVVAVADLSGIPRSTTARQ